MTDDNLQRQLVEAQDTIRALQQELEETNHGVVALTLEVERVNEEVRAAEEKYRTLFDNSSDAIFIHDLAGHFLEVNRVACERLGYSREELLKMTPGDIDTPGHSARMVSEGPRLLEELQQRGHLVMETAHVRRDGTVIPTELSARLIEFAGVPAVLSVARDITERKRAEEALRESERKLRLIAENTPDVIFAYDMDRRLIYVNPAVEQLTGYSVAELQEKNFINWLHPEDEAGMMRRWEELFAGKSFQGEEFRIVTRDGQVKWCLGSWGPLYDESRRQIGIQGRERDITERKHAETETKRNAARVEALLRVAARLNTQLELDALLRAVCEETQRALSVPASALYLYDAERDALFLAADCGLPRKFRERHQPPPRAQYEAFARRMGAVNMIPDAQAVPDLPNADLCRELDIRTIAGATLLRDDELVGALSVYTFGEVREFSPDELELLKGIADQAALAIGRAQAEKATRDSRDAVLNMLDDLSQAAARDQARVKELEFLTERLSLATEESDRLATQLAAINRLDRIISSSLDLNEIYRAFAEESRKIISFDRMSVALVEGDQLRVLAVESGIETVFGAESILPLSGGVAEAVIESGQPLVRRDLVAEEHYPQDRALIEAGLRSGVLVPLAAKGRVLGAFNVASRQVNAYAEKDLPLLQSLADQLAIAVENARLYVAVQQRAGELAALYEITHDLAAQHDLPALLQTIAERAAALLSASGSGMYLYDTARNDLELAVAHGYPISLGTRLGPGEGMAGRVAQTHQPLIVDDYHTWEGRSPKYADAPFSAVLEVPMLYGGELIGVLGVEELGETTRKFVEADERLLSLFAAQAAGAVHNARLYQKVAASEQEYRTLVENATELIWTLDTEGRFTYLNRQAEAASGQKAEDWLGKSFAPLIAPPEDLPRIQQVFLKTLAGKPQSYEVGVYRPDDSVFHLSVNTTPLYRDGQVIGTISFGRDVTAQQEAEAALTQRMAELSSLFEVSSALRGAKTVDEMLPTILKTTIGVTHSDAGAILLLDSAGGPSSFDLRSGGSEPALSLSKGPALIVRAAEGQMAHLLGIRLPIDDNVPSRVLKSREPHIIPHLAAEPLIPPPLREQLRGIESAVVLPLQVGETGVGVMNVAHIAPHVFTEAEVRLLTAIADMAASAIHRAGLFEQLEHRVHELSALFDVGKMVTATLRIEDVLQFVVGAATEAVHAEGCSLFLWDERQQRLVMRAVMGALPELVGQVKYRSGEGLVGWVFLEGRAVNVPDVAADPRWKPELEQEMTLPTGQIRNVLIVPLHIGEKMLGALGVSNKIGAPAFTAGDELLLTTLAGQIAIAIENARLYEDVRDLSVAAIRSLATAIDARDPYTRGHSEGVTHLAVQLARKLGWGGADLEMLEFAALLHDVGKIAVPDAILRKVEPLTSDEWTIIRLHPYHSAQIVKPVESLRRIVSWVYHHQERWDGSGYPDGVKGEAIPLASRIIAVADAFDAITTDRPYRKALAVAEALAEIERNAGKQFDPQVAEVFLRMMGGSTEKSPS